MLTHIVVWKYKAEVSAEERDEHVARLRALASVVPELQTLAVGFDVLRLPRSYDLGSSPSSLTAPRLRLTTRTRSTGASSSTDAG